MKVLHRYSVTQDWSFQMKDVIEESHLSLLNFIAIWNIISTFERMEFQELLKSIFQSDFPIYPNVNNVYKLRYIHNCSLTKSIE